MARSYAEGTSVSVDSSMAEIRAVLRRYGADEFGLVEGRNRAGVAFTFDGTPYRIDIPLPDRDDPAFWKTPGRGLERAPEQARSAWESECRRRWRVTVLLLKAQLEWATVTGTPPGEVLVDHRILPDGRRLVDAMLPQLARVSAGAPTPCLLPWYPREGEGR